MSMITGPANYTSRYLWRVGGPMSMVYLAIIVVVINLLY
jgi:di/tricarboxylate transporter